MLRSKKKLGVIVGMKKAVAAILCIVLSLFVLTACGSKGGKDQDNVYIPETDYPLMYEAATAGLSIAECDTGYYYLWGHYIFYADKETMESVPLCNKPDCKHTEEPDSEKVYYCNAYLGGRSVLPFIQYYEGEIYTIEGFNATAKRDENCLVKISPDGSERERLTEVPKNAVFAIHRGYFYSAINGDRGTDGGKIVRVPIDRPDAEPEVVFESELDSSAFYLYAKGNYLLIVNWGNMDGGKTYYHRVYTHNIQTGETMQLLREEEGSDGYPQPGIYYSNDDRLIYSKNYPIESINEPVMEENILYTCDLNGENETVFQDLREKTDKFAVKISFDGTYYYEEWVNGMLDEEQQKGRQFNVYDRDFHLLYQGNMDWLPGFGFYEAIYGTGPHVFFKNIVDGSIDYVEKSALAQGQFEPKRFAEDPQTPSIMWRN